MTTINNDAFVKSLQARGMKTTSITDPKEATFEDYGNALSAEAQKMILDSFDSKEDYALQAKVGSFFKTKSNCTISELQRFCKDNGIEMKRIDAPKGSKHMADEKATGHGSRQMANGLNLYEISDGKGGKFIIADANGNAAIETEEIFMNEILSGISSDIAAGNLSGAGSSGSYNQIAQTQEPEMFSFSDKPKMFDETSKETKDADDRMALSQSDYDLLVSGKTNELMEAGKYTITWKAEDAAKEEIDKEYKVAA